MSTTTAIKSIKPWPLQVAKENSQMACRQFKCDWNHGNSSEEKENCCACMLNGYRSASAKADGQTKESGPNVSGWARLYVQAGRTIPGRWFGAFMDELNSDNEPYSEALKRDVVTYGLRIENRPLLS